MAEQILQVAAYCRVSTDKEDQLHSLEAQRQFFEEYVQSREGWHLEGIYADEGLSGTAAARRPRFMEMVDRALLGKIGLIITKEVSRFARNTVDALEITRRLKEKGVGVVFLTDGIDTRDSDGEFRLTIMASVAQEESRKISQRTRWGQLQAMRRGGGIRQWQPVRLYAAGGEAVSSPQTGGGGAGDLSSLSGGGGGGGFHRPSSHSGGDPAPPARGSVVGPDRAGDPP